MKSVLHPTYFPDILTTAALVQSDQILFEICDNYQKQSYRNRMYIGTAYGRLLLNIPIKHTGTGSHKKTADALIEQSFHWQRQHWRSLIIAYRTSPFFEFYEDDLYPLFHNEFDSLLNLNKASLNCISEMLGITPETMNTREYKMNYEKSEFTDLRNLADAKRKPEIELPRYRQVFEEKNGFIPHLSVLDLIFNLGPESLSYLNDLDLKPLLNSKV
ncbi:MULTISPECIES: WbqC family protein [unclassified Leeuwenhoekiella]|uniref:WbqC family protein n=1 Tax=unclassified Leeuwenhoekiella TaxID=2615029 RepID=UPI000C56F7F5|nr:MULTISPECIES: WbqC family protein [unclassified Leeuwenhoekiella]MAW94563.1 hypothetical protein [Leeuwenhoekiella sp.]MBA81986.1 hypothetical protein [Leeuwenhoekiella sp.]